MSTAVLRSRRCRWAVCARTLVDAGFGQGWDFGNIGTCCRNLIDVAAALQAAA